MKTITLSEKAKFYLNMYAAIYLTCNDFNYDNCQSAIDNNDNWEDCVEKAKADCGGDMESDAFIEKVMSYYEPQAERLAMEIWDYYKNISSEGLGLFSILLLMQDEDYILYK